MTFLTSLLSIILNWKFISRKHTEITRAYLIFRLQTHNTYKGKTQCHKGKVVRNRFPTNITIKTSKDRVIFQNTGETISLTYLLSSKLPITQAVIGLRLRTHDDFSRERLTVLIKKLFVTSALWYFQLYVLTLSVIILLLLRKLWRVILYWLYPLSTTRHANDKCLYFAWKQRKLSTKGKQQMHSSNGALWGVGFSFLVSQTHMFKKPLRFTRSVA